MSRHTKVIVVEEVEENEDEERNYKSLEIETKVQKTPPASPGVHRKVDTPPAFKTQANKKTGNMENNIVKRSSKMEKMMGNGVKTSQNLSVISNMVINEVKSGKNSDMLGAGGIFGADPEDVLEDMDDSLNKPKKMPKMFGGDGGGVGNGGSNKMKNMVKKMALAGSMNKATKAFMQIAEESHKNIEDTLLYKLLKPLFILMKITGIFFVRRRRALNLHHRLRNFRKCSLEQAWCTFILVILILNFLRSLTTFIGADLSSFSNEIFFKCMIVIFFYESMSRAALAYRACYKEKDGLESFFINFESICFPDKIIPYENALVRTNWFFIILTMVLSLCNLASVIFGFYFANDVVQRLFDAYLAPMSHTDKGVAGFEAFVVLLSYLDGQVAILSLTFFTVICYMLYKEFQYSDRIFRMKIKDDGTFSDDLEKFRLNHQRRCKLVEQADGLFKEYIANTYTTNVPLLCLLFYSVAYNELADEAYRVISGYRTVYVMLQFLILSVAATLINIQAHAPLEDIYGIKVSHTTPERNLEVNMFLNKLTGTSIGLTAWDMFVINKPTILTMIGMILTYFFLLMQFKLPTSGTSPANCTCLLQGVYNATNITLIPI